MHMRHIHRLSLACALALCAPSPAAAQVPTQKVLTFDLANEMAQEAINFCRNYNARITVVVVDHTNNVKAILHDDGVDRATHDVARMKATTVILFGGSPSGGRGVPGPSSGDGCDAVAAVGRGAAGAGPGGAAPGAPDGARAGGAPPAPGPQFGVPGTLNVGGGHPIRSGDQVVGAIAVSGTGPTVVPGGDSGCACAAIAKVRDRLR